MAFISEVRKQAELFAERIEHLQTEEATKHSLILPFLDMLGYSIFDPTEVVPEYTADIGTRLAEKVDYALMQDGDAIILIEAKPCGADLGPDAMAQLYRYFGVTRAHFGILTDGLKYQFYADIDEPNVMDTQPFFVFDMQCFSEGDIDELLRFSRSGFDECNTMKAATTLKYTQGMKQALARQMSVPDEEFTEWLVHQVYGKPLDTEDVDRFGPIVKRAYREFIVESANGSDQEVQTPGADTTLTDEELEALEVVRSVLADIVEPERIIMRKLTSYCRINLDDNRTQTICRLYFYYQHTYLAVFDRERNQQDYQLESVREIGNHAETLQATVRRFLES